jgi:imidazole glycerol-phosphate synthase subunit HisH
MIAIIDYNMGNLLSVSKAFETVGGDIKIVDKPDELENASGIVLPGVGNFGEGMEHLRNRGFEAPLLAAIKSGVPFMGICLGMQMLMEYSEEAPGVKGLAVFKGGVIKFPAGIEKVPHMGWNSITVQQRDAAPLAGIEDDSYFYFVHSYYVAPENQTVVAASCSYITEFAAAVGYKNIFATQFHPEKSQDKGLAILTSFVKSTA